MEGIIIKPFFESNLRKYLDVQVGDTILHIKVPFRYGRVSGCTVEGLTPVQDMPAGTRVIIETKKVYWDGLEYYVLKKICPL